MHMTEIKQNNSLALINQTIRERICSIKFKILFYESSIRDSENYIKKEKIRYNNMINEIISILKRV